MPACCRTTWHSSGSAPSASSAPIDRQPRVLQLADIAVLVAAVLLRPAQEDIALALHDALAGDHALALIGVEAWRGERRQDRLLRLLELQQQRRIVAGGEQADGTERTDAADPHHLERNVGQAIAIEQHAALFRQAELVRFERGARDQFVRVVMLIGEWRDQRRPATDPPAGFSALQQLRIPSAVRLGGRAQPFQFTLAQPGIGNALQHARHGNTRSPRTQRIEPHQHRHVPAVRRNDAAREVAAGTAPACRGHARPPRNSSRDVSGPIRTAPAASRRNR